MGKIFKLGPVEIDPVELGSQGNAVLGIRDSGKSYTATKLAEELFDAGIPFIAFDPIGVWRYLRVPGAGKGYPIIVAGGEEADLPLSPETAPMIVEAAMKNGVSLVIDLFDIKLSKADWRRIVRDCVRLLLHRNKEYGLRHVFLEEAAEFAPQKVLDGHVYAEIEKLARMGGNSRLGYTLINQRAQEVNKAVLELCDNLFLHRQKGKNALEGVKKWLDVAGAASTDVMRSLPTLPQGECWAWLSDSDTPIHVKVPAKNSMHPDRRMMHGNAAAAPKKAVKVDRFVAALQKTLPRLEEEAKANDPAALRREIQQLQTKLAAAEQTNAPAWPDQREQVKQLSVEIGQLRAGYEFQRQRIEAAVSALTSKPGPKVHFVDVDSRPAPMPMDVTEYKPVTKELTVTVPEGDGTVPSGCNKPLAALAGAFPAGMTESQWAMVAGYKKTGGTWCEYRRRLVRAGMIEQRGGLWFATQLGADAAGPVELPPAPGPNLVRWWAPKIQAPLHVVEKLIEVYPGGYTRAELAEAIGMAATGGSFQEYVRRLLRNSIATEQNGRVTLSATVMG